jgi:hypothetical protein
MTGRVSRWVVRGGCFVVAALLACVFTSWIGLRPRPVLVIAAVLGGFALAWMITDVGPRITRVEWTPPRRRIAPRHGLDPRFLRLASLMRDETDSRLVNFRVHQSLSRIVDDRLLTHHGVDRAAQPQQAAALLGPELTQYLEQPPTNRDLNPHHLNQLITRIEAL